MNGTIESTARHALSELLEVSPQIEYAIVSSHDGTALASVRRTGIDGPHIPTALGSVLARILEEADRGRRELGREPVTQCEIATGDGNVFVVSDDTRLVAAMTAPEPTVGLVFYDLKTALRSVRDADQARTNGSALPPAAERTEGAEA
jgi:predicted regulator of Ras-like GTPase activity (Roadblock/LC7/MglB family)